MTIPTVTATDDRTVTTDAGSLTWSTLTAACNQADPALASAYRGVLRQAHEMRPCPQSEAAVSLVREADRRDAAIEADRADDAARRASVCEVSLDRVPASQSETGRTYWTVTGRDARGQAVHSPERLCHSEGEARDLARRLYPARAAWYCTNVAIDGTILPVG